MRGEDRLWDAGSELLKRPEITRSTMMGLPCLRVEGRFCAAFDRATGDVLIKVAAARVDQLILQSAASEAVSDMGSRAALYSMTLSSALIALGFAAQSREILIPFMATVVPILVLLGIVTVVRLIDAALEYNKTMAGTARIRAYYRTLSPEAASFFAARYGRWPEKTAEPTLRLGTAVAFATTTASMVAVMTSIVAGAGVAVLVGNRLGEGSLVRAVGSGLLVGLVLMGVFFLYQRWRYAQMPA